MDNKLSKFASAMGKVGGKKSAEKRLGGMTEKEISEMMARIRIKQSTPEFKKFVKDAGQAFVDNLNKNVTKNKS